MQNQIKAYVSANTVEIKPNVYQIIKYMYF
jgi:hypothetical protein